MTFREEKAMANGGAAGSRGYIFQAIIALIECLEKDRDWDAIKNEPATKEDKVDIMLYKEGKTVSAIQVKSSLYPFGKKDVEEWLGKLRGDAKEAEEVCLCLVGDNFTKECGDFINANPAEIKTVSFEHLQSESTVKLIEYINGAGLGEKVMVSAIKPLEKDLFYKILMNSQSNEPVSREEFEASFKNAVSNEKELAERIAEALSGKMQQEAPIRKCLTPVPPINKEIGLVGREDILKKIRNNLEKNNCIVLVNGLGGIGKTAVMQGICNELKDEGYYVAWISCGDSLREDLLTLRDGLGIPEADDSDTAYRKIKDILQSDHRLAGDLYLFLDDLSRPLSEEEQGILNGLGIHVMATSRFAHDNFLNLPLDVLAEESALDMFYGYYLEKRTDKTPVFKDAAREIIRSVQSHTLLVELLAKAASKKGGTLEAFRNELKKQGVFDVFKRNLSTNHDKNKSIEECVIELYKISELTPDQQHIMKLFTIFTPEKEIYYMIGEWAGLNLDALDQLVELGWLEQGGLENGYQIHQIVRDSLARQMDNEGETVRLEEYGKLLDRVADIDSYLGIEIPYQFIRERLVLAEDLAGFIEKSGREDADVGKLFNNIGRVFYNQGDYEKALTYYKKSLEINESVQESDNPSAAATYDNIAQVYDKQGDYEKALEYFKKALAIRERVLGPDHSSTATTYNNMAVLYDHQGDYEKALEYFEKALAICERMLGPDHPDTATIYNNMAGVYDNQSDYEKALEYFKKTLAIRERVLGPDHPDTAATYNNMALVYDKQGDYKMALEYYEKALVIYERVLGPDHPDTATIYNNMALVYNKQGNYKKALEYYEKALAIKKRVLGQDHPDTATTYNNMALVYFKQGDYEKALEYYEKSLAISEWVLGPDHPDTATTYSNMAYVFYHQGNYTKSLEYFKKAYAIWSSKLGENHLDTQTVKSNIDYLESRLRN